MVVIQVIVNGSVVAVAPASLGLRVETQIVKVAGPPPQPSESAPVAPLAAAPEPSPKPEKSPPKKRS